MLTTVENKTVISKENPSIQSNVFTIPKNKRVEKVQNKIIKEFEEKNKYDNNLENEKFWLNRENTILNEQHSMK